MAMASGLSLGRGAPSTTGNQMLRQGNYASRPRALICKEDSFKKLFPEERYHIICTIGNMHERLMLLQWDKERREEDAVRMSKLMDLGAAMEDPASGGLWTDVLKMVARAHMSTDAHAPLLFRVNRQFETCWRLAAKTTAIDVAFFKMRVPVAMRTERMNLAIQVIKQRDELKMAAVLRLWTVKEASLECNPNTVFFNRGLDA